MVAMSRMIVFIIIAGLFSSSLQAQENMKRNLLTPEEQRVIIHKGTERAFAGEYIDFKKKGTYLCKHCDAPLYESDTKFDAQCGWPSFDDEIEGAVKRIPDSDGSRTEIACANCNGHLGHVFLGEGFTSSNTRHCVNSISLKFVKKVDKENMKTETAIFAGGCFWGVEHLYKNTEGVLNIEVGYIGGHKINPTYEEVCAHLTGHTEAVRLTFNPDIVSYRKLAELFFEIHDPTQLNRQGPDVGDQYRSEVFFADPDQERISLELLDILKTKGYKVVTKVTPASSFWPAENYHQDYYARTGGSPYCHVYTKRF